MELPGVPARAGVMARPSHTASIRVQITAPRPSSLAKLAPGSRLQPIIRPLWAGLSRRGLPYPPTVI